jgi:hypothetical protein
LSSKLRRLADLRNSLIHRYWIINDDDPVKSQKSRRSRAGGSPELLDLPGFPLSRRNDEIGIKTTFYESIFDEQLYDICKENTGGFGDFLIQIDIFMLKLPPVAP